MASLDLDINNYSIKEIEKFFRINPKKKYTAAEIELREVTIRQQLIKSGHVDKRFIKDLIEFTQLAKDWLIFVKCPEPPAPTTLPKNTRLDTQDYPRSAVPPQTREGEILTRENTSFIYTQPSAFFPGNMNPLTNRVLTKCLTIDTKFRENYYDTESSDFITQLPTKLLKVVSMELASIELPVSFHYISKDRGNNFLWIKTAYMAFYIREEPPYCPHCEQLEIPYCQNCMDQFYCPQCQLPPVEAPHCHQCEQPEIPYITGAFYCPQCASPPSCPHCGEHPEEIETNYEEILEAERQIIIPDGNYSACQLIEAINNILCPKDASGNWLEKRDIFSYIQFAIDTAETNYFGMGLVRIQGYGKAGSNIQNISLDFSKNKDGLNDHTLLSTRLGWILGFQQVNYDGPFLLADTFAQDAYFKYIYFAADDFQNNSNNHYITSFQTSIFQPNILARLSFNPKEIETTYFSNSFNMVAEPRIYFGPVDIQRLQFRLFDEYGRIIDMNHANYSFCIKIQFLYNL